MAWERERTPMPMLMGMMAPVRSNIAHRPLVGWNCRTWAASAWAISLPSWVRHQLNGRREGMDAWLRQVQGKTASPATGKSPGWYYKNLYRPTRMAFHQRWSSSLNTLLDARFSVTNQFSARKLTR